jgi:hypothetical protein
MPVGRGPRRLPWWAIQVLLQPWWFDFTIPKSKSLAACTTSTPKTWKFCQAAGVHEHHHKPVAGAPIPAIHP